VIAVIDSGGLLPLSITAITARLAPQPWIYFESADGAPLTATYGDPQLQRPHYDLEASRRGIPTVAVAQAKWSPATVAPRSSAPGDGVPMAGAPIERKAFRYARTLGAMPRGLTSLVLDAHVLAHSDALRDVRLTDSGGNQIPYLIECRDSPLPIRLAVPGRQSAERNQSVYRFTLPYDALPAGAKLVLRTSARVFDRQVVLRRPADESHGRDAEVIESATWQSSDPDSDPPPLTFAAPARRAHALELEIDEGDNAPLPIVSAELLLPSYALRFVNPGSPLTLLYGNGSIAPPRYDLALLAPRLFGQSSHEVTLAAAEPADGAGTTSRERKIFWIVIAAAAVILLFTLTRLLRGVTAPAS